ncbi:cell wall hydrolase [Novosphingobium sp. Chol11]|uniref:cell wall hydrolase n=1 Tax=Novosphingobium sp. Chol11 TaxID=1385763 RepID=UPI0025D63A41|nr:cell wall hydrolase [Novosphingobium sp. Chol11]
MSRKFRIASTVCVLATIVTTLISAGGSGAHAQDLQIAVLEAPGASVVTAHSDTSAIPAVETPLPQPEMSQPEGVALPESAASLEAMAAAFEAPVKLPREIQCMASAIYFEAKSETLAGQLAVGRVIAARARSGRFPASYCGVVLQRSQFSFVRGGTIPVINRASAAWQRAVKIALIADKGAWQSPVEGALFFHAARVSPSWGKARMAQVDNHVFYR